MPCLIQGKVHKAEDVQRVVTDMLERFKSKMEAMPAKLAIKLENRSRTEIQRVLKKEINGALLELSEYNPADYYSDEHIEADEDIIYSLNDEGNGHEEK